LNKAFSSARGLAVLAAVIVAPASAFGQTAIGDADWFRPTADRPLSDPLYLPFAGQLYGWTAYSFNNPAGDNYANNPAFRTSSFARHDNEFTQGLSFALTDDIALRASASYGWSDDKVTYGLGTETYNFNGLANPAFGVTWRALDQMASSPVDLDFLLTVDPQVTSARAASLTSDGSFAEGHDHAELAVAVGREMRNFTIAGKFTATYYGDGGYLEPSGIQYSESSSWNYDFNIDTQTRLTDAWSIDAGIQYTLVGDVHDIDNFGYNLRAVSGNDFYFSTAVNYQIIPNRFVATVSYEYGDLGNTAKYFANDVPDTQIRNYSTNVFGARLNYVFN
jgi:hypothetical protein